MRELDRLSLMVLAQVEPRRAVCSTLHRNTQPNTLWHAKCAHKNEEESIKLNMRHRVFFLPVDNEIVTWGNGCILCSRRVETENLKPF